NDIKRSQTDAHGKIDHEKGAAKVESTKKDPNFQRLMSRLQLIDLLCLQIDRGPQNYFVQYNAAGKVIGVTGIDNDLSFGRAVGNETNNFDGKFKAQELPGISRYVDKDMAQRIINLNPSLLHIAVGHLLSPDEMNALIQRLTLLQAALSKAETKLLEPDQWGEHIEHVINETHEGSFASRNYVGNLQ
ncbi:hypothetical protein ACFLYO_11655, partial [Chloroflexota bacterium]